ncbi:hypothetical protein Nepgr_009884 [Nepenthes gracilis]|uniref:J domain-containing protein n=1 Tax=Nepenthes gracilis TaxID=150966 RepID=A0AAD3SC95_NEPGR|nr:hypothetical protein Nepgr_009884 [Nepenthes gracilis]
MYCDALVSGSTLLFSLSSKHTLLSLQRSTPNHYLGLSETRLFGSTRTTRAAINDGSVKPVSEMTLYELLGIPQTVTLPEIKQAYKELARKFHPDVSPPHLVEEYTQRFIEVQEAYETLSDPRRRAMYDRDMARGLRLAFSARKMCKYDEEIEDRSEWKSRWQNQLSELKRRSMYKDARKDLSWAAQVRRQRNESSVES